MREIEPLYNGVNVNWFTTMENNTEVLQKKLKIVNVVYHIDLFANTEESLHPRDKPTWSRCMIFLICCWILFVRILLRIFASMFISASCSLCVCVCVCVCVASLSGFDIRVMVASENEFGNLPSSTIFWKSLNRIGVSYSLNFW